MKADGRASEPGGRKSEALSNLGLDKVIHERARLMVLTYIASSGEAEVGFTQIRDDLGFTAGNLSVQLRTLEEAGYVEISKKFVSNKSYTGARLTSAGKRALEGYLADLEVIVASLKLSPRGAQATAEAREGETEHE